MFENMATKNLEDLKFLTSDDGCILLAGTNSYAVSHDGGIHWMIVSSCST